MTEPYPTSNAPSFWRKLCFWILGRIDHGTISITTPHGQIYSFEGRKSNYPAADITIHDERAWRDLVLGGHRGFFHGYIAQKWFSSDLEALFGFYIENRTIIEKILTQKGWMPFLFRFENLTAKLPARHHNAFFAQWLDSNLTYSCALYTQDNQSLEEAQAQKHQSICDRLGLEPHHKVLEIGPGFGSFGLYAARHYGVRVTLLTDNGQQKAFLEHLIDSQNMAALVDVQMRHPKDVPQKYDRVVVIEHIERTGDLTWPQFFRNIYDCLVPGGRVELQCIVMKQNLYTHVGSFFSSDVKKGCDVPEVGILNEYVTDAGFLDLGHIHIGENYVRTVADWRTNFFNNWPNIQVMGYDAKFRRLWILCMAYCAAGFKSSILDVIQKTIVKPEQ